jgi:hypothetical protein
MRIKALFFLLLLLELCFGAAPFARSTLPYRPRAARAFLEFRQNPNPQTESAWRYESSMLRRDGLIADGIIFGLLAANTICLIVVGRKAFRRANSSVQQL